jgi:hypothetical protein
MSSWGGANVILRRCVAPTKDLATRLATVSQDPSSAFGFLRMTLMLPQDDSLFHRSFASLRMTAPLSLLPSPHSLLYLVKKNHDFPPRLS